MKYKETIHGHPWYAKIHELGEREEFNAEKHPFGKEMQEWIDEGNEIESLYTAAELEEKEAKDKADALKNQEHTLLSLIKDNEYHFINGRYEADREQWQAVFDKWYYQLEEVKDGTLVEIEPKPVFN